MEFRETVSAACRERYTENIAKDIIAFLNGDGGVIWLGVDSTGKAIGLEQPGLTILKTANECYDAILPEISGLLHYTRITADGKDVLKLSVTRGTSGLYFLAKEGMSPEGVFIRQGSSTVSASEEMIRAMIRKADGASFEEQRSRLQDLTFEQAGREFELQDMSLDETEMNKLHMIGKEGLYTNLGLLLSDQCPFRIKMAVFRSDETTLLQESRIFEGSLLKQLRDTEEYLDLSNLSAFDRSDSAAATRKDPTVRDGREYPPEALQEVLRNALLHREYSDSADTLISVFENRTEVVSYGGLPGITMDDVKLGLSVCRNPGLAAIFCRLQLAQSIGTGIRRIQKSYGQSVKKPVFYSSANVFKVLLPNISVSGQMPVNGKKKAVGRAVSYGPGAHSDGSFSKFPANTDVSDPEGNLDTALLNDERAQVILQYLQETETASRSELQQAAGVSPAGTVRLLRRLCDAGLVEALGRGKCTRYRIVMNEDG